MQPIDSVLLIGFGGPSGPGEVMPFLEQVVRGRGVSAKRLEEVAHHYQVIGGRSPYTEIVCRQATALHGRLRAGYGLELPVYVGMRNWHPYLKDTLREMHSDGLRHSVGLILAAHRCATSIERYQLDVRRALEANDGAGPQVTYPAPWFFEPAFLEANAGRIEEAVSWKRGEWPAETPLLFTAHSIPCAMAENSFYRDDLEVSSRGVAELLEALDWSLAYQSRSGDGKVPWLGPDICDVVREKAAAGAMRLVVHPIGFLQDHVEVLYDLDVEAAAVAREVGVELIRSQSVEDHPVFIDLLAARVAGIAALCAS